MTFQIFYVPVPHLLKEMDLPVKVGILLVHDYLLFRPQFTDPCNSGPCDTNAECARDSVLNSDFTCTCTSPFEGEWIYHSVKVGTSILNGFTCESTHISDLLYHSS